MDQSIVTSTKFDIELSIVHHDLCWKTGFLVVNCLAIFYQLAFGCLELEALCIQLRVSVLGLPSDAIPTQPWIYIRLSPLELTP